MKAFSSIKSKAVFIFSLETVLILIGVSMALIRDRNPMRYFDEGGFITWLSILQLFFIGYLCHKISQLRLRQNMPWRGWRNPGRAWQVMMLGFIFLALDEYFQIHEALDAMIQGLFGLEKAPIWSRIDDFIILFYAIVGIVFLQTFKKEIRQFTSSSKWFFIGFVFCFLTIALDMLSHDATMMAPFVQTADQLKDVHNWLKTLEEIPKILAEGAFIVAFECCLVVAKAKFKNPSLLPNEQVQETV